MYNNVFYEYTYTYLNNINSSLKQIKFDNTIDYNNFFIKKQTTKTDFKKLTCEYEYDEFTVISVPSVLKVLDFFYDESGVCVFIYSNQMYCYRKNLTGTIIKIYNDIGEIVAKYKYDAFKNHLVYNENDIVQTNVKFIGNINPFRYKGYYFDVKTRLYYCISRYYNPQWCRFLQPKDLYNLNSTDINGLNLYAYYGNNPVRYQNTFASIDILDGVSNNSANSNIGSQVANIFLPWLKFFNLFGYEKITSNGWDISPEIATSWFGRVGHSTYITKTEGDSKIIYGFYGSTTDTLNLLDTTYYAGIGIKLFNTISMEYQIEIFGIGSQLSIGRFSIAYNTNLIGGTSLAVGWTTDIGNDKTKTDGVTIGLNTGLLVFVVAWIYILVTTGEMFLVPKYVPINKKGKKYEYKNRKNYR